MNFTTPIPISKSNSPIDYNSRILSLGSCFAENMDEKFNYFKFQITTNPFGIIFNPVSIEKLIARVVNQELFTENNIFFHNERWHCYEVHSELSNSNKEEFLENLNKILQSTLNQITKSTHIIITYGTSWVYRNKTSNEIVANCHKVPQNKFDKELLSVETIQKSIENTINLVQKINPNCHFIFTVSPVRHIKDGFVENTVSKAHLLTSIYQLLQTEHCKLNTEYFPSYEIMMDELRDYRFYADDMLHPSQSAIDYIWIKFFENYINEKEFATMQHVCDIQKALHHKPFNENSESHQKFLENLNQKINILAKKNPQIQF
ncbi:GSCFA domain-containing protein [Flavobacterium sp.]|uniref:GSCFA domain-containing protein n=1 Tax=Flavobacterium sp. TaxID=239 RepID=UPI003753906C